MNYVRPHNRIKSLSRRFVSVLLSSSLFFIPMSGQAVHLLHTATTFADYADDVRVGIEVEFTGLTLKDTIQLIQSMTGGNVVKKEKRIKTTLKEVNEHGMVYNESVIPEWVIQNSTVGDLIIKIDNNQVTDDSVLDPADTVLELVTAPIRKAQVLKLQGVIDALKKHGAKGTGDGEAVSIQFNTEINEGKIATYNWQNLIDLLRVYMSPEHRMQIDPHLEIPDFRKNYIGLYSKGFLKRVFDANYKPTSRELFDDFFYRQSLELLGHQDAWTMNITAAKQLLLAEKNPVVPLVVKQNKLRISSLLAMAYPEDPITKIYISSGWITPMPVVEWREFNNDFNVLEHYREVMGLMFMTKRYGSFSHDKIMSQLSGIEESMIKDLRKQSFEQIKHKSEKPTIFRYFIGNPKTVDKSEYSVMKRAYEKNPVGFLPFYEHGTFPISIPGKSVVMHRNQMHRLNVVGSHNPGLINGFIMQALENKYVEMRFWSDYTKEGIPESKLLSEIGMNSFNATNKAEIISEVKQALKTLNQNFPKGWVLKGLFDLGTEKDILSDKLDLVKAVDGYLKTDFDSYRQKVLQKYADLNTAPEYALTELKAHKGYKGWKVLQLLKNANSVMIQERYDIQKEFRVEVVAGHVLGGTTTIDRYAYANKLANGKLDPSYPRPTKEQISKAEAFARNLIQSLPPELSGMTFGLDVAITHDGQAVMIESNPGGNSNFLYEEEAPSVKVLTKFLSKLPEMVKEGEINLGMKPKAQMQFLKQKFAQWRVNTTELYPGMKFLDDHIEDAEFKKIEATDKTEKSPIERIETNTGSTGIRCEAVFH